MRAKPVERHLTRNRDCHCCADDHAFRADTGSMRNQSTRDTDEWRDDLAFDSEFYSLIRAVGTIPALVTRRGAYTIEQLQLGLHLTPTPGTLPATFAPPEVEVVLINTDGTISPAEQSVLLRAARSLHIPAEVIASIWSSYQGGGGQGGGRRQTAAQASQPLSQAYAALGIEQSATDAEVKKAYRKLVGQYHPDKLVSQGLPEEMMEMARKRVREINTAYDRVKQARGFK